jgi:hypothetical protein
VLVLVAAGYLIYHSFRNVTAPPPAPGCQAGTGVQAVDLDPEQAEVAATIAGVAARHRLPRQAVTIALAAALQESKLHNLDYGDRDSVGIFQQRPSEGWGSVAQLQDPVYATTKFYTALAKVHGYTAMPVYRAGGKPSWCGSPRTVRARKRAAPRSCTSGRPPAGRWPAGWSRTLRRTTSAKYGMPVSPGKPPVAVWAGSASPTRHRRQERPISSLAEAASSGDPPYCVSRTTTGVHP